MQYRLETFDWTAAGIAHRRQQAQHHTGDGGMNVRAQHPIPHQQRGQHEGAGATLPKALHHPHQRDAAERDQHALERDAIGIKKRNDQHRDDVVNNRDGKQQHAQSVRHTPSEQGQHADREGDIGSGRHRPAALRRETVIEGQIDQRRCDYATQRRDERQAREAQARERAVMRLASDFETDDEEEQGHEAVVDPHAQWHGRGVGAQAGYRHPCPQRDVVRGPARIGP